MKLYYVVFSDASEPRSYYTDTREMHGHGGFSNIFTSSHDRSDATKYGNLSAAQEWIDEFDSFGNWKIERVEE